MSGITTLIFVAVVMFCILGGVTLLAHIYNLNSIKSKTVGDGQHGTARWATKSEIRKIYNHIPFTPKKWRKQAAKGETPTVSRIVKRRFFKKKNEEPEEALPQGIVVGCTGGKHHTTAMVDTGDVHALMIGAASFGQNAYFYDAAEGLLTATILLVAEFCEPQKRHIVSVFKIIQELLAPSSRKGKNQFQKLMELLPNDHKAKWFAGAALNTAEQSMASVMSTALSRLNAFLDSELEQLLCFDTEIDAEKFCNEKSAIFVIIPEENPVTYFMISLIIQQLYREILAVADESKGKLKNRCIFFCDEFGTLPKIESAEMMFSASRSRRLQIVPIIQSFSQLDKNYGKEGAEIIVDNTQLTIFGGFAPNSSSAEVLSKALGSRTVMSGSVSRSKNDPSQSLQMIERPLLTPDELKSMPKGQFVVMKTGVHPMRVRLKLFSKWGISFNEEDPYTVADKGDRKVVYAEKQEIIEGIMKKYRAKEYEEMKEAEAAAAAGVQDQEKSQSNEPQQTPPQNSNDKKKGGNDLKTEPPSRRHSPPSRENREVKPSEQA